MIEEWKDIEGYEGIYQISNLGRVKSLDRLDSSNHRLKGNIRKFGTSPNGYVNIALFKQGKRDVFTVHRLVAETFILNPENKPQVNHIDEDKTNNMVSNLEWMTAKENVNHGTRTEKVISKMSKEVYCVNNGKTYINARIAGLDLGISRETIRDTCNGKQKSAKGYTFKYREVN